ncbi:MAG: hypothetical protein ACTHXA_08480 [Gulosibacter sp.]
MSNPSEQELDTNLDEQPEDLAPRHWVTLSMFALFVVLFGTCATTFLFN